MVKGARSVHHRLQAISEATGRQLVDVVADATDALERIRLPKRFVTRWMCFAKIHLRGRHTWPNSTSRFQMALPDEIWLFDFGEPFPGEPANRRPAVIVGPSRLFGDGLPFVIAVPVTTTRRQLSFHVELESAATTGLDDVSYAQCELIRSISTRRLTRLIGRVSVQTAREIETIVKRLHDY